MQQRSLRYGSSSHCSSRPSFQPSTSSHCSSRPAFQPFTPTRRWHTPHIPNASAIDHLVLTVDGFNAAKATATYPPLKQLQQETVEPSLAVIQDILPQRILGSTLTQHPQLLETDMAAWLEFLIAFGFDASIIQELLRSCPEVFYKSNVFQVCVWAVVHKAQFKQLAQKNHNLVMCWQLTPAVCLVVVCCIHHLPAGWAAAVVSAA